MAPPGVPPQTHFPFRTWHSPYSSGSQADSPLHKALEEAVQDMAPIPHEADILRRAVNTLPVEDGALKHVAELLPRAQEVWAHEVHHTPVLDEVVLQGVSGQHHPAAGADALQGLRGAGLTVLDAMSLVTDHHIRARAA